MGGCALQVDSSIHVGNRLSVMVSFCDVLSGCDVLRFLKTTVKYLVCEECSWLWSNWVTFLCLLTIWKPKVSSFCVAW